MSRLQVLPNPSQLRHIDDPIERSDILVHLWRDPHATGSTATVSSGDYPSRLLTLLIALQELTALTISYQRETEAAE